MSDSAQIERVDSLEHFDAGTRGQVRAFRRKVAASAKQIDESIRRESTRDLITAWLFKKGKGRERVEPRLKAALPGVRWHPRSRYNGRDIMLGAYLRSEKAIRTNPIYAGQTQDCVVVECVLLDAQGTNSARAATYQRNLWTLEVTDHALGRIVQRAPGVDLAEVIFAGHAEALQVAFSEISRRDDTGLYMRESTFSLATPPWGAFRCQACLGVAEEDPDLSVRYLRVVTWLDNDLIEPWQAPVKHGKPNLSETFLVPICLEHRVFFNKLVPR